MLYPISELTEEELCQMRREIIATRTHCQCALQRNTEQLKRGAPNKHKGQCVASTNIALKSIPMLDSYLVEIEAEIARRRQ